MPLLKDTDLAYLAGILDGEGHIGLVRRKRDWKRSSGPSYYLRPVVQIGQAKRGMLDHIRTVVGAGSLNGGHTREDGRVFFNLRFDATTLRWLLPAVIPHLVVKRRQAEIVVEFLERCRYAGKQLTAEEHARREGLRAELEILNTKPFQRITAERLRVIDGDREVA